MSWITVVWPIIAGACLTLAAMHLLVWIKDRRAGASLASAGQRNPQSNTMKTNTLPKTALAALFSVALALAVAASVHAGEISHYNGGFLNIRIFSCRQSP